MSDETGSPTTLPAGQRYAVVSAPFSNRSISFCTPRATITQTRPAASPVRLVAEPVSEGVRSTGVPPAAGTVHTWSGVSTLVVVLRNARVRPPSVHAMPLTALGTSAARRDPFGPQTSIVEHEILEADLGRLGNERHRRGIARPGHRTASDRDHRRFASTLDTTRRRWCRQRSRRRGWCAPARPPSGLRRAGSARPGRRAPRSARRPVRSAPSGCREAAR